MKGFILISGISLFANLIPYVKCEANTNDLNFSTGQCLGLGFNRDNLICSSCDQLKNYNLEFMKQNCSQCCQPDPNVQKPIKKYPKAKIEVCDCNLGRFPQVQAFVKDDKFLKNYPNLQVRYVRAQLPQIKLINEKGLAQKTLSITKWDTATISEFLNTYLE